jgi:hypothetical protein
MLMTVSPKKDLLTACYYVDHRSLLAERLKWKGESLSIQDIIYHSFLREYPEPKF